jgi:hypothetical protein
MSTKKNALAATETVSPYVEFERRAAAIYLSLARRFRDNAELSSFWLGMRAAEEQHAVVLAFCECQHLLDDDATGDPPDPRELSGLFRNLEVRVARPELSIDDAFMIAAELEGSEINAIYEHFLRPTHGTPYFIRKKIETLGVNHPRILAQAAKRFGVSAPVLERLTQLDHEELH